ncbi:MAG: hypothetical protein IJM62_02185, partial [Lachnospiraceae bacterium]|nr:hypothetical protein [Lachnospiraceae bacterium]
TKYNTESREITGADNAQKALVEKAQEALKEQWKKIYEKNSNVVKSDGTLRIIRTRIIEPAEIPEGYEGYFGDIETIVEFELYTDNAGSAPYYMNGHNYNEIIFHKDGTTEPASFYLKKVASAKADFSFVEGFKVTDLGDAFNGEYNVGGTK